MDAHIAKPFQDEELFQAIEDLCGVEHGTPAPAASQKIVASGPQFDEQELLKRVGGSAKMMRDVAKIFVEDTPKRMTAIRKAIAREDGAALASAAHALRGSVAMLGAVDIADEIRKVETLGREGSVGRASEILASFESKLSVFEKRIAGIAGEAAQRQTHSRRSGGPKARRRRP